MDISFLFSLKNYGTGYFTIQLNRNKQRNGINKNYIK